MPFTDHDSSTVSALLIAVSDNTNDSIFVKSCDGELIFANPATLRMLGKSREEALFCTSHGLLIDAEEALSARTREAAHAADEYVHESPWTAIGVAAGVGVLVGLLLGRR